MIVCVGECPDGFFDGGHRRQLSLTMKICTIQQPYPYDPKDADASVRFLIDELDRCDDSMDLIVTPEYSNCPSNFPPGESLPFAKAHTPALVAAAVAAARRCNAIVALSFCAEVNGVYRNTTRIFAPDGSVAGDYYKQQLVVREPASRQVDGSYTFGCRRPTIVEANGIRFGFVTCYDAYFEEYIEHLAYRRPDVVLVCSHQRGERFDVLETLNKSLAFHTNAFVVRASVGMGEGVETGGSSMVVDPSGRILANAGPRNGALVCEVGDIHRKYTRSDSFGGPPVDNFDFFEKGRTPWCYRPAGPSVIPCDAAVPFPRICAHRGFNTIAPENSIPAFAAAIALGAEEIEFDLWPSRDGVPVVLHDPTLDRVSNGSGHVTEKTLAELKELDFGSRFAPAFAGLKISTFEEILARFPRQAIMNIHVKTSDKVTPAFVRLVCDLLRDYDALGHCYVMAVEPVHDVFRKVAPELPRCMGAGSRPLEIVDRAIAYGCTRVQFFKPHLNAEMIRHAHDNGIVCNVFWSDDPEEAARFFADGIDTVLTNDYWRVRAVKPRPKSR